MFGTRPEFFQRWNPFNKYIQFEILESHILGRKGQVKNNVHLQVENFVETLTSLDQDVNIKNEPVQLDTYFNLWGTVYDQSRMGFHKTRGLGRWEMR